MCLTFWLTVFTSCVLSLFFHRRYAYTAIARRVVSTWTDLPSHVALLLSRDVCNWINARFPLISVVVSELSLRYLLSLHLKWQVRKTLCRKRGWHFTVSEEPLVIAESRTTRAFETWYCRRPGSSALTSRLLVVGRWSPTLDVNVNHIRFQLRRSWRGSTSSDAAVVGRSSFRRRKLLTTVT